MKQFFSLLTPHLIFLSLTFWTGYVSGLNLNMPNFMSKSCCKYYEFCFEEIEISKVDIFSIQNSLIWHLPWVSFFCLDFQKTVKSNRWQLGRPLLVGRQPDIGSPSGQSPIRLHCFLEIQTEKNTHGRCLIQEFWTKLVATKMC